MYKLYKSVIVGIDEGDHGEAILTAAIRIAKEAQAKLIIVSSLPLVLDTSYSYNSIEGGFMSAYIGPTATEIESAINGRKDMIEKLVANITQDKDIELNIIVSLEDPKDLILGTTKDYDGTLIVLGATSKKSLERFFVGSVAQYIVNNAPSDVLIIK
ncbi:MAG: universal stress protein [Culicoidibacterales bacterium]